MFNISHVIFSPTFSRFTLGDVAPDNCDNCLLFPLTARGLLPDRRHVSAPTPQRLEAAQLDVSSSSSTTHTTPLQNPTPPNNRRRIATRRQPTVCGFPTSKAAPSTLPSSPPASSSSRARSLLQPCHCPPLHGLRTLHIPLAQSFRPVDFRLPVPARCATVLTPISLSPSLAICVFAARASGPATD